MTPVKVCQLNGSFALSSRLCAQVSAPAGLSVPDELDEAVNLTIQGRRPVVINLADVRNGPEALPHSAWIKGRFAVLPFGNLTDGFRPIPVIVCGPIKVRFLAANIPPSARYEGACGAGRLRLG